jgi:prepilin-type N-terminal cleavage/methylation domain-containing protein
MKHTRGFTLIELIIGMTLLGFILALLFGGFRLASTSWNVIEDRAERAADEQAGHALIRRLITYVLPLHSKQLTDQRLTFTGGPNVLRMTTPLPQLGLRVVELAIEPEELSGKSENNRSGLRVVLRNGPLRYDIDNFMDTPVDAQGHLVLGNLNEATFNYFGIGKPTEPAQWFDQWLNSDRFPALVRVHLVPKHSPPIDLDIAPMANGDRKAIVRLTAGPV